MDFAENTLFKSSGVIYCLRLPFLLPDELSMDRRDNEGFFSTRLVGRSSDSSYNTTDWSLITLKYRELLGFPRVYQNC